MAIFRYREHHCYCCHRAIGAEGITRPIWCSDCRGHLIDGDGLSLNQRTYEAQHGVLCPFTILTALEEDGEDDHLTVTNLKVVASGAV